MPLYGTLTPINLSAFETATVFDAESTATITTSQACVLTPDIGKSTTACVISGFFSGDPGTFELDVQFAAEDADANYQTALNGGQIQTVDSGFHFLQQFSPALAQFVRLK